MRLSVCLTTPDVTIPVPVALLSGSLDDKLDRAARLGLDGVELMVARPHELDSHRLRAQLQSRGLTAAAIGSGAIAGAERLTLLAGDDETRSRARSRLDELIEFAAQVGASVVTIGSFRGRLSFAPGLDGRAYLAGVLRAAGEGAVARGIPLAIEPLNRYETDFLQNAEETLTFLDEVGSPLVGLLLDTFHMNIEEPAFEQTIRRAAHAGKLFHVHIGDSNRLPPGRGHTDFPAIVSALRAVDYNGWLSAELFPLPDPDTAAEQTVAYLKPLLRGRT